MTVFVVSVAVALSISALCSLMEATLLSLTPSQVADISQRHPKRGNIWQGFKANIEHPIASILLLNTAAHTIGAAVAGSQFDKLFGDRWIVAFSLLFTYFMLQFTEILPKTLGVRYNQRIALLITRPLQGLVLLLKPVLYLVHLINRPFEGRRGDESPQPTVDEITALASLARLSDQLSFHQERIITGATSLSEKQVHDLMLPVDQIAFLSTSQTLAEALIAAHLEAHTRFPVCENNDRNRVVGYVNFKELVYHMRTNPQEPSLLGITRPIRFALPEDSATDLLRTFVSEHVHIAVVRDGEGRTVGLVTLEDLVEELVGELEDEFDRLPRMLHALSGGTWMVGGGVPMADVATQTGLTLSEPKGTVSAWLTSRLGRVPKPGEEFRDGLALFTIRRTRRGKIFEVALRKAA